MDAAEIRDMTDPEIREKLAETQEELFRLRFRSASQPIDSPALFQSLRRDVARLKTILRERELEAEREARLEAEPAGD